MKVIFDFASLGGGAPKSQLSHMQVFHEAGHEVLCTVGNVHVEKLQSWAPRVKVVGVKNFSTLNFLGNVRSFIFWSKLLNKEKPDLVYSNRVGQARYLAVLAEWAGVPFVYAQAGGNAAIGSIWPFRKNYNVCYSHENKEVFSSAGCDPDKVFVVANRIPLVDRQKVFYEKQSLNHSTQLKILAIGNLKAETICGYLFLLDYLSSYKDVDGWSLEVIGKKSSSQISFEENEEFERLLERLNSNNLSRAVQCGWVDNVFEYLQHADVVLGKGRSIIEPAMSGKICFVVGEGGRLTRVKPSTFEQLFRFNFSGRGNQEDNTDELAFLLNSACRSEAFSRYIKEARDVAPLVVDNYLDEGAYGKLLFVFESSIADHVKPKFNLLRKFRSFTLLLKVYLGMLHNKVFYKGHR